MKDSSEIRASEESRGESCPICSGHSLIGLTSSGIGSRYHKLADGLEKMAPVLPPLFLRLLLAYEFGEAGVMKLQGENWFADLAFPFPFSLLSSETLWWLVTGFETAGAMALLLGLATRFFSFALMVITFVAIASVHWPTQWSTLSELLQGYSITDQGHGNYKLPLMYLIMFLPLLFGGAGKLSIDAWLSRQNKSPRLSSKQAQQQPVSAEP